MRIQPDLLLFFTDGFGNAPKQPPAYPVMWVLTHDGKQPAPWGRVVHFKSDEKR
jgi:predicted metal-dependent peptidase